MRWTNRSAVSATLPLINQIIETNNTRLENLVLFCLISFLFLYLFVSLSPRVTYFLCYSMSRIRFTFALSKACSDFFSSTRHLLRAPLISRYSFLIPFNSFGEMKIKTDEYLSAIISQKCCKREIYAAVRNFNCFNCRSKMFDGNYYRMINISRESFNLSFGWKENYPLDEIIVNTLKDF